MRMIQAFPVVLMLVVAATAHAAPDEATSAPASDSANQLAALQAQIPLWQARARIAKLKAEIQHAEKGGSTNEHGTISGANVADAPVATPPSMGSRPPSSAQAPTIHLETVSAYNGHYVALLDINGAGVQVRQGDEISGGWTISRITDSAVELVRGKESRLLRL